MACLPAGVRHTPGCWLHAPECARALSEPAVQRRPHPRPAPAVAYKRLAEHVAGPRQHGASQPEPYCRSSGQGPETTCTCLTEQETKARLQLDMCKHLALNGPAYNPYRAPREPSSSGSQAAAPSVSHGPSAQTISPAASAVIGVADRAMATFPESPQNRYGGR